MRERKLELIIIEVSVLLAVLIILVGTVQRLTASEKDNMSSQTVVTSSKTTTNATASTTSGSIQSFPKITGKVVAIGDSFTYGYPLGTDASWVTLAGKVLGLEFVNKGLIGQTSADLLARFQPDVVAQKPQAVIILIGTGDGLRGVPLETYQQNIQQLVKLAKDNKITPIIGLPLLYPDTHSQKLISSYRDWLIKYTTQENLQVIDFKSLYDSQGSLLKEYTADGKYPNKQGYQAMAKVVEEALEKEAN